jgi:hypothetical protein
LTFTSRLCESENESEAREQKLSIDRLLGSRELRVGEFELEKFLEEEESKLAAFKQKASRYYLY